MTGIVRLGNLGFMEAAEDGLIARDGNVIGDNGTELPARHSNKKQSTFGHDPPRRLLARVQDTKSKYLIFRFLLSLPGPSPPMLLGHLWPFYIHHVFPRLESSLRFSCFPPVRSRGFFAPTMGQDWD